VQARLTAVNKTQLLLADKLEVRAAEMKGRVRALYKLSRASFPRLWVEADERRNVSRWLGAARKITMRDQDELRLLREEIDVANAAELRLRAIEKQRLGKVVEPKSLRSPLAKTQILGAYGEYQGPARKVQLRRRGITLRAKAGEEVFTPAPGHIVYVGPIAGLGEAMILKHEGFTSIVGHVAPGTYAIGDAVAADEVIARASGEPLYLELRLRIGSVGQVVDPTPLLAP
jgi:murein DD-endopeptidase MepM/ murein hydrolase activator NlpD